MSYSEKIESILDTFNDWLDEALELQEAVKVITKMCSIDNLDDVQKITSAVLDDFYRRFPIESIRKIITK